MEKGQGNEGFKKKVKKEDMMQKLSRLGGGNNPQTSGDDDESLMDETTFDVNQEAPGNILVSLYGLKDQSDAISFSRSNLLNFLVYSPGLWVRDVEELKRMMIDIGGECFRRTKDLRIVALLYIAAGKKDVFVTLSKTDRGGDGGKIGKLLGGNLEGKKAQLSKNAYSLMSKRGENRRESNFTLPSNY